MAKGMKPTLITLVLSAAAALGYVTFRLTLDRPSEEPHQAAAQGGLPTELPAFEMPGLEGEPVSIRSWPGQPLVINFWATWCAPCLREIPMLKTFQDEHPWLTVVGIAIDDMPKVQAFNEDLQFNYPILVGATEGVAAAASFGVDFYALPFTIFTDGEGRTLGVRTGEIHPAHLQELIGVLEDLTAARIDLDGARARIADVM